MSTCSILVFQPVGLSFISGDRPAPVALCRRQISGCKMASKKADMIRLPVLSIQAAAVDALFIVARDLSMHASSAWDTFPDPTLLDD